MQKLCFCAWRAEVFRVIFSVLEEKVLMGRAVVVLTGFWATLANRTPSIAETAARQVSSAYAELMPQDEKKSSPIHGVFSTIERIQSGSGASKKVKTAKRFWLIHEKENGQAEATPVNENLIAIGEMKIVSLDNVLSVFQPEPDFYQHKQFFPSKDAKPKVPTIEGFEISGSPEEMEKNARASFGMGLMYLKQGNHERAQHVFEELAKVEVDLKPEHKHMFNDFGVSLRKQHLFDTALKHYLRAMTIASDDDNLMHNIARAYYEKAEFHQAVVYLKKSLELNPEHEMSRRFLEWLKRKHKESLSPADLFDME